MTDDEFMPPFAAFAPNAPEQTELRRRIAEAYRRPEEECLPPLVEAASFDPALKARIAATARQLAEGLRKPGGGHSAVEELVQEYALSSAEGIALMCLAEALLRIPDAATRDALIRDKIAHGDWQAHLNKGRSLFANAATWGLIITGKLTSAADDEGLSGRLTALLCRYGEPLIRKSVAKAINMMGAQFVRGETIESALKAAAALEAKGFRYSYDMLGEAAMTDADARAYYDSYERAVHAIGQASAGKGIYQGAGISIKLSALHPRYVRAQKERVMRELLPRVRALALLAKRYNIGFNIDAEEADRLELSLDILDALLFDESLTGWDGIGFVAQAYGRRCPFALDYIIDAARRSGHRVMLRLVKGAYWDSEIKRAQSDGLPSYPVYTRKVFTDIAYIACAKKLLAAPDAIFPQFATHNAQTLATIYHLAGADCPPERYEFQCLHGMGEPLYSQVVGAGKLGRPARIYAPVGSYETLLAYLVRRLLENGANSSFVHRIADKSVSLADLIKDPVDSAAALPNYRQNDKIAAPKDIFLPKRRNSDGLDLSDETVLAALSAQFQKYSEQEYYAVPSARRAAFAAAAAGREEVDEYDRQLIAENAAVKAVLNPADRRDIVGYALEAAADDVSKSFAEVQKGALCWREESAAERAAILAKAADMMQAQAPELLALCCREAGKSIANGVAELREAVDFLRFYGADAQASFTAAQKPLGVVVCISPWNFPLAIFIGQIAAALAAGNGVLAKPAEETPLIAARAVEILHEAGVPRDVLHLVPGDGAVGAALVAQKAAAAVVFTGSLPAARSIQAQLAGRTGSAKTGGKPIPLIAETGGQNALIVDSSALAEQVVADCIASAFDSAGQRCSALRILCLQEEIAERFIAMLKGAMAELSIGRTDILSNDIGPVITQEAAANINGHIKAMRAKGFKITQLPLKKQAVAHGSFVAPTIIEIDAVSSLKGEVFGPVLHILRYKRTELEQLMRDISATGYGLTFGLHTRLNGVINAVSARAEAGNIYINRNIIGAIVGSQPFGGRGLSGTGPKAGGPLYAGRLAQPAPKIDRAALQSFAAGGGSATAAARAAGAENGAGAESAKAGEYGQDEDSLGMRVGADAEQKRLSGRASARVKALAAFARSRGFAAVAAYAEKAGRESLLGLDIELPGPVGEENRYKLRPRGTVFVAAESEEGLLFMLAACLASGNKMAVKAAGAARAAVAALPKLVSERISLADNVAQALPLAAALLEGAGASLAELRGALAAADGAIIPVQAADLAEMQAEAAAAEAERAAAAKRAGAAEDERAQAESAGAEGAEGGRDAAPAAAEKSAAVAAPAAFALNFLLEEVSVSNNIAAVGGNAKLMNIG